MYADWRFSPPRRSILVLGNSTPRSAAKMRTKRGLGPTES